MSDAAADAGPPVAPSATYRLQLSPDFGFAAAAGLVGYLADLGVTHLYLSPVLTAVAGSSHGYDVADPTTVSAALGGEDGLRLLADAAAAAGLGLVVDIVPNHVGIGPDNPLWELLLAEGAGGLGGSVFDVDWAPPLPGADGKVILPLLGDQYGQVLARGELTVADTEHGPRLRYHDHSFPLSPESVEALDRAGGAAAVNGSPDDPASFERLHALLESQHYRLTYWRPGDALINYRRFFAIKELAAVRVEDDDVFDRTHAKILQLVDDGVIQGLRVDHPDGLRDPARYLQRLARLSGGIWTVVEKILHAGEPLPDWPVAGTTGYDFCNDVLGLFVDPAAREVFDQLDSEEYGSSDPFAGAGGGEPGDGIAAEGLTGYARLADDAKSFKLDTDLAADFQRLSRRLWGLAQTDLRVRDVSLRDCDWLLGAVLCSFEVYRTYVDPQTGVASPADRRALDQAFATPGYDLGSVGGLAAWLRRVLAGEADSSPAHLEFIARFQQLSSALMAKGAEDTAFYRYRRLLALNEVGGDPTRFGLDVAAFHAANERRARSHPAGMLTTATHDTKRGEDVRLRIAALTELPDRWAGVFRTWTDRSPLHPDDAQLVFQTLVGVWPLVNSGGSQPGLVERLRDYVVKALREAGEGTSWTDPVAAYEGEVAGFATAALGEEAFRRDLGDVATAANEIAMVSGLAQTLLRCMSPGIPDTYQGNELWDDSLVDPDNRRPVDFDQRRRLLAQLDAGGVDPAQLYADRGDGRVKLWVLSRALRERREHAGAVGLDAGYQPLATGGRWKDRVVTFARTAAGGSAELVVVTPRLPGAIMGPQLRPPLADAWDDTTLDLPRGDWRDVLTGASPVSGSIRLGEILTALPVALLAHQSSG